MNFDWTTFLLEILNFFILLWVLRRFLYRPILDVIGQRQRRIEDQLREAEAARAEAREARTACEQRLADWERERAGAYARLERDLAAERERLLAAAEADAAEARARRQAQDTRERQEWERLAGERAVELGGRFVSRMLARLASPELQARLVDMAVSDLKALPEAERERLRAALSDQSVDVATGYTLAESQRAALSEALAKLAGQAVAPVFREEPSLLAGLRVHAGPWALNANLRDELKFFGEVDGHDGT